MQENIKTLFLHLKQGMQESRFVKDETFFPFRRTKLCITFIMNHIDIEY